MSTRVDDVILAMLDIAPEHLAADWDNVGMLVWTHAERHRPLTRVLLTIDLTDAVMDEAVSKGANIIIAYHPPIFAPIKYLSKTQHSVVVRAVQEDIAVYSPHTALDAAPGGMNDWLAGAFGPASQVEPVEPTPAPDSAEDSVKVVVFVPRDHLDVLRNAVCAIPGVATIGAYTHCTYTLDGVGTFLGDETTNPAVGQRGKLETVEEVRLEFVADTSGLPRIADAIRKAHPYEEPAWDVYRLVAKPEPGAGQGRRITLAKPATLNTLVKRVKEHLKLKSVRVAEASSKRGKKLKTAAVCPGAGGSVLKHAYTDVVLTGEMRHHDVLAANAAGTSVILTDHTNTERGYLPVLKKKLHEKLGKSVKIDISKKDADPLRIV